MVASRTDPIGAVRQQRRQAAQPERPPVTGPTRRAGLVQSDPTEVSVESDEPAVREHKCISALRSDGTVSDRCAQAVAANLKALGKTSLW